MTDSASFDHEVDLLVVGSGAGAMTTAIVAHDQGASTLLLEKSAHYGGSSAMSGGGLWIPNNRLMKQCNIDDSTRRRLGLSVMTIIERLRSPEDADPGLSSKNSPEAPATTS